MRTLVLAALGALTLGVTSPALAAGSLGKEPREVEWSFSGPFGQYDMAQVRRGYQVYKQVCSACHGLKFLSYRNLAEPGGPFHTGRIGETNPGEDAVKALIADITVPDIDVNGDPIDRPARLSDTFKYPFANKAQGAAANGGKYPPDLSVMIKARPNGANYVYSLLTGYQDPPPGKDVGLAWYNPYYPGSVIAMPAPIVPDSGFVYDEPNSPEATVEQMAKDVTAFMAWASEPKMEERKQLGLQVLLFMAVLTVLLYLSYRRVWRDVDH